MSNVEMLEPATEDRFHPDPERSYTNERKNGLLHFAAGGKGDRAAPLMRRLADERSRVSVHRLTGIIHAGEDIRRRAEIPKFLRRME